MTENTNLELEILLNADSFSLGAPVEAQIVLKNKGDDPVLVNSRLGMGYGDSEQRELWCKVQRNGESYDGYLDWKLDYNRKQLNASHFVELAGGASVKSQVDFHEWYHMDQVGEYEFEVVYDPEAATEHGFSDPSSAKGVVKFTVVN